MKFKPMFFAVFLLLAVSPSIVQGANWISISAMAFVGDADIVMKKNDYMSSYLRLITSLGSAWAPVNFPPNAKGKNVVRMEALVYDGNDAHYGILDVSNIVVYLVKVDLATGLSIDVMSAGTVGLGAPGLLTVSATYATDAEIDNKKWAWHVRCQVDDFNGNEYGYLRLYGVRIRYK